ncbi:MAG TPA: transposase, partial [Fimbriiglobus sp.]|nr:transposase [Fimbriiglobus sp.]
GQSVMSLTREARAAGTAAVPGKIAMSPAASHHPRGWHSRGYLPHFEAGHELPQSVTFRLADSLPAAVVHRWLDELAHRPPREQDTELRKRAEAFLDTGYGACHLRDERVGALVETALLFFDAQRYHLHAWVVMPNHVHTLFTPTSGHGLSDIVGSWKSFTAKQANKLLGRSGQFWREDYFDRFIRDEEHFAGASEYIEINPVKAGLCVQSEDWPFGSARRR